VQNLARRLRMGGGDLQQINHVFDVHEIALLPSCGRSGVLRLQAKSCA
jgi:hypothetical protein